MDALHPLVSEIALMELADQALYHSKKTGRNKVTYQLNTQ